MMGTEKTKEELLEEIAFLQKKLQILEQHNRQLSPSFLPKNSDEAPLAYQKNEIESNESAKEFICLHDLTGKIIRVNDEVAEIFDIYNKDGSNYNLKIFLAPDTRQYFSNYLNEVMRDKKSEGSLKIIDKEGNIRVIQYKAHFVEGENHQPYIHCKAKDISHSKEKFLNASNEFYKSLYEKNVSYILLLSLDGQIVDANETALQRFHSLKEEIIGVKFADWALANNMDIGQHTLTNIYHEVRQGKTIKIAVSGIEDAEKSTTELAFKKAKFYKQDMIICFGDDITNTYDGEQEIISKYNELRVIKETIRYVSGQYKVTEVLMMALEKLYELDYVKSAGFYKTNQNGFSARLRFHLNIENEILAHILEIRIEDYLAVFSEKQPYEIPAGVLYPEQEALMFIPIIVENKVNFALLFKLDTETHDGSSLLLNLLGAELSSYLTQTQLNNKLVQSENRFRIIADNSPSLLRMTNSRNEFIFFSQPWFVFTGKSNERQLRDNWGELIHKEDIEGVRDVLKDNFTGRNSFELSYRLRRSDGEYRWMLENGMPYYDQEREFKGYICSAVDVTERRQKEKEKSQEDAIKYSKERLQKALNQANIFAITVETNGLISYCNQFFYEKTSWKEEDVIGKYLFNVFEPDMEGEAQLFHIDGFLNTFEGTLHTAGKEAVHIRFNSIVLNDRTGNIASFTIVGEDVNEKYRVQEALRESNMRLQDLFDNANDLIQVTGSDGKILFANRAWKQTLGYSDEELESLKIMDILHPDKAIDTYRTFGKVKKTGEVSSAQTALVAKNGKKIDLSGRFSYDEKENEFRAYLYNITERIRLDNAQNLYYNIATLTLNSTNLESLYEGFYNALRRVIEVDSFVIAIKDKYDDKKIYFPYHINSKFAPKEGIQGINFVNYAVANFERPIFMYEGVIKQIISKKKLIPDTVIPKVWLGVPLKLGEKIIGMIVLQAFKEAKLYNKKDLTLLSFISGQLAIAIKRSQNQEEISQQAARLKAIFDSGTHLMWTVNRQMLVTRFNQKANTKANNNEGNTIVPSDLVGYEDTTDKLKQGEFLYFWLNKYRKTFEGKQQHFESKIINEHGIEIWYEVFLNPIKVVGAEDIDEISGVANNITAKKRYELALAEAKEVAEKSLEVKKSFLSNMSHEIRTPMNGIIGMIELLADSTLDEEQQSWITTMRKSSETLLNILNDILDLSKIEAGKMELRKTPISLKAIIDKLFALFMQRALSKDITMIDSFEKEVPIFVSADETRLLQILSNLTSNALKFTEHGEINIRFLHISQNGKLHKIKVEVQDSGIGIPEEKLAILFKAFSQADNSYTKSYGGTGLGLVISQELCKLMNGDIGVESILGKGSTFWFTFEAEECRAEDVPIEENFMSKQGGGHIERISYIAKILVVDDNSVNLKVAKSILQKAGCTVETAQSGQTAINLVRQNHYDIIFMDIQMPIMNGVTTTQHIKALNLQIMPPVIAMTAFSMQEERQSFLDAGMDDYVSKPIKAQILINKVKEWSEKIGLPHKLVPIAEEKEDSNEPINIELISPKKEVESLFRVTHKHIIGLIINKEIVDQLRKYGDDEMIEATYQEFEEETTNIINELTDKIDKHLIKEAMGCAHTIKGSAGTLGIERLAAHATKMEQEFKNGIFDNAKQDLDTMNILFDEFKENYRDLI
ncbi:MAG: PAS domain S-box protein [Cytophagales bacterium]|nr:MAG: PAS domain S-box protein [Cytophagales bacterium]